MGEEERPSNCSASCFCQQLPPPTPTPANCFRGINKKSRILGTGSGVPAPPELVSPSVKWEVCQLMGELSPRSPFILTMLEETVVGPVLRAVRERSEGRTGKRGGCQWLQKP